MCSKPNEDLELTENCLISIFQMLVLLLEDEMDHVSDT